MLEVRGLSAGYGRARVLFGLSLHAAEGEVVALLGRNGAGKSTALKSIMGLLPREGEVRFDGRNAQGLEPYQLARLGLGYVPEDRRIFTGLTVAQNLQVGMRRPLAGAPHWNLLKLLELFPALKPLLDRNAGRLSGGEQQMLSIARTLAGSPRAVLLDEPSEGLAPLVVQQMAAAIRALKAQGLTLLLAEQSRHFAERVADRAYILEKGEIVGEQ
jgi:branched-chain amino acid transport system ATP-binding protein